MHVTEKCSTLQFANHLMYQVQIALLLLQSLIRWYILEKIIHQVFYAIFS